MRHPLVDVQEGVDLFLAPDRVVVEVGEAQASRGRSISLPRCPFFVPRHCILLRVLANRPCSSLSVRARPCTLCSGMTSENSPWSPLRHSLYRWLWIASVASYIGTWLQNVGASWLMTSLSSSASLVALVQAATSMSENSAS